MEIRRPNRVTHSYTQRLVAPPERVLPLLCPVREAEWLERWDPRLVLTESGFAEPGCVFVTASEPQDAVWIVSRLDAQAGIVEMIKISPEVTACQLSIAVSPAAHGSDAVVTYTHTSLGPRGDAFVAAFDAAYYLDFMRDWELRLNHFLATGERLTSS
jgi:hypothetical protein